MFQFGSLERWLSEQAAQGWLFDEVKHSYCFVFHQAKPIAMTYAFDYRGLLLEDYMSELFRRGWTMTKINKYWSVWAKQQRKGMDRFKTSSDDEVLRLLRRSVIAQVVLTLICLFLPYGIAAGFAVPWLIFVVFYVAAVMMLYHLLRLVLYRAMIQVRNEQ